MRRRIPNNVKRGGQTSTSFNICNNKRNVECLLNQSLNACKLIQHRFNFDSTCFNKAKQGLNVGGGGGGGEQKVFNVAVHQNRTDVEAMNKRDPVMTRKVTARGR